MNAYIHVYVIFFFFLLKTHLIILVCNKDNNVCVIFLSQILQWQHMLRNPPQYISVLKEEVKGHSLILLASQSPPEVCCFLINNTSGNVMQALDSPWCLSRIEYDFYQK